MLLAPRAHGPAARARRGGGAAPPLPAHARLPAAAGHADPAPAARRDADEQRAVRLPVVHGARRAAQVRALRRRGRGGEGVSALLLAVHRDALHPVALRGHRHAHSRGGPLLLHPLPRRRAALRLAAHREGPRRPRHRLLALPPPTAAAALPVSPTARRVLDEQGAGPGDAGGSRAPPVLLVGDRVAADPADALGRAAARHAALPAAAGASPAHRSPPPPPRRRVAARAPGHRPADPLPAGGPEPARRLLLLLRLLPRGAGGHPQGVHADFEERDCFVFRE